MSQTSTRAVSDQVVALHEIIKVTRNTGPRTREKLGFASHGREDILVMIGAEWGDIRSVQITKNTHFFYTMGRSAAF